MTNDLIQRLRELGKSHDDFTIGEEAADEIERLQARVAELEQASASARTSAP